jgi:hypothetical protein
MKLTERKIEALAVEHGRKDRLIFDGEQRGLAVRVTAKGGAGPTCANIRCTAKNGGSLWARAPRFRCQARGGPPQP